MRLALDPEAEPMLHDRIDLDVVHFHATAGYRATVAIELPSPVDDQRSLDAHGKHDRLLLAHDRRMAVRGRDATAKKPCPIGLRAPAWRDNEFPNPIDSEVSNILAQVAGS